MAITLHTTKGTESFTDLLTAAAWLEEYQPSAVSASINGSEQFSIDCDGAWDADEAVGLLRQAIRDNLTEYVMDIPVWQGGRVTHVERRHVDAHDVPAAQLLFRDGGHRDCEVYTIEAYEAEFGGRDALHVLFVDGEPYGDNDQIEGLLQESAEVGDMEQVDLCRKALDGDFAARCACSVVLTDAIAARGSAQ